VATLLHLDSSSIGSASVSRTVARTFLDAWTGDVVHRDLAERPVPHLTAAGISSRYLDEVDWSDEHRAAAAVQDELIEELLAADAYLFTVPLYNYSMPSVFKAWLDQVLVAGRTLGFGPEGAPTAGRPALVVSARGGGYGPGTPNLDVRSITPELTFAPIVPAMTELIPLHETSLRTSHRLAAEHARTFSSALAA
jgi:FMN-dependent NADH-azoreductase